MLNQIVFANETKNLGKVMNFISEKQGYNKNCRTRLDMTNHDSVNLQKGEISDDKIIKNYLESPTLDMEMEPEYKVSEEIYMLTDEMKA